MKQIKKNIMEIVLSRTNDDDIESVGFSDVFYIGKQAYVALEKDDEYFLFRIIENEGKERLQDIEDEQEYWLVLDEFKKQVNNSPLS